MSDSINSTVIDIQSWFIPIDILLILCTTFSLTVSMIFLVTIFRDKTCRTIPMLLVANSCLAEFVFSSDMLSMALFTLTNDLKQIQYKDSLCIFRGYFGYVVTILQNYSYFHQAFYRYISILYPHRLFYQSFQFQVYLICLTWIVAFLCPLPYLLTNQIQYNVENQICQMPLHLSFLTIYNALGVYIIPISLIVFIYLKLVRYVQEMSEKVTPVNESFHIQRELRMVRRIVILVLSITTIGFPYALFVFVSFFTTPPIYHFRIAYIFVDGSLVFVMIALFQFTDPLKASIIKCISKPMNTIIPTIQ